ncbi:hypothetical protein NDU88_005515 [Pleurodeles waltl]|uniref:Uncharacterized protein n=1 Tax=Pleurodeles waltl TaxID=8319 RepID=A0AAV7WZR3_PLEWA|nr:hypothetical protein NDU88_005515 [Pleurodeles waltl]
MKTADHCFLTRPAATAHSPHSQQLLLLVGSTRAGSQPTCDAVLGAAWTSSALHEQVWVRVGLRGRAPHIYSRQILGIDLAESRSLIVSISLGPPGCYLEHLAAFKQTVVKGELRS